MASKRPKTVRPVTFPTIHYEKVSPRVDSKRKVVEVRIGNPKKTVEERMRADLMLRTDHHVIRSIKQLDRDDTKKLKTNRLLDSSFNRISEGMKEITKPFIGTTSRSAKKKTNMEEI
jgi:hypothetical protein